jgi:hypothetical protein
MYLVLIETIRGKCKISVIGVRGFVCDYATTLGLCKKVAIKEDIMSSISIVTEPVSQRYSSYCYSVIKVALAYNLNV